MAEEETPVASATEEINASEESTANEVVTDETGEETAESNAVESTDSNAVEPELTESLSVAEGASTEAASVQVEGGRDYELMFIVRITESTEAATARVRTIIEESGGVVDNVRVSEQRRLSYPIKKEIEGFYVIINGRFTKEAAAELDRALKLDEAVLRHMTIRLDEE